MKDMAAKAGVQRRAVRHRRLRRQAPEELGNPVYPPARRELAAHGVPSDGPHTARQMTRADYDEYDLLIGMDSANILPI